MDQFISSHCINRHITNVIGCQRDSQRTAHRYALKKFTRTFHKGVLLKIIFIILVFLALWYDNRMVRNMS